jgi:hypothetical protein
MTLAALVTMELPLAAHAELARLRRACSVLDSRWTASAQVVRWADPAHTTLWLAAVELPHAPAWEAVEVALRRAARDLRPVHARLAPPRWRVEGDEATLELDVVCDDDALSNTQRALHDALRALGFEPPGAPVVVTLARVRNVSTALPELALTKSEPFELAQLDVCTSSGQGVTRRARLVLKHDAPNAHDTEAAEAHAVVEALDARLRSIPLPKASAADAPRLTARRKVADIDEDSPEDTTDEASSDDADSTAE